MTPEQWVVRVAAEFGWHWFGHSLDSEGRVDGQHFNAKVAVSD